MSVVSKAQFSPHFSWVKCISEMAEKKCKEHSDSPSGNVPSSRHQRSVSKEPSKDNEMYPSEPVTGTATIEPEENSEKQQSPAPATTVPTQTTKAVPDSPVTDDKNRISITVSGKSNGIAETSEPAVAQSPPNEPDQDSNGAANHRNSHTTTNDTVISTQRSQLVSPAEIKVNQLPTQTAESVLTPFEQLKRLDQVISDAHAKKQQIICEQFRVPPDDFHSIADVAAQPEAARDDLNNIALAAYALTQLLSEIVNDHLTVPTEQQQVQASSKAVLCDDCFAASNAPPAAPLDFSEDPHNLDDVYVDIQSVK